MTRRMFSITNGQIEAWLAQFIWPFIRIGACLMVAPIFAAQFVQARVRLVLAGAITLLVLPLLPVQPAVQMLSAQGFVITAQQLVIGAALGFALQIIFDSLAMGGQLLSNSMGLLFAFNVDPLRGASTPVVGQFYMLLVTLTFLSLDGHLVLIETMVDGFQTLPIGMMGLGPNGLWELVGWGTQLFHGALSVALPGMTALLIVNLGFGVVSRAAPTLNLFAVGFPVTLICGLIILMIGLPAVQTTFVDLIRETFVLLGRIQAEGA
ncbi:MAG: flagellar biosynthetic protein FliR [Steroidobacteraceae bacterium]